MKYKSLTAAELNRVLAGTADQDMSFNIRRMNSMFKLPINDQPTVEASLLGGDDVVTRLTKFKKTLLDEVEEVNTIIEKIGKVPQEEVLTDIADWLGDIEVYCRSEALKFGIPMDAVLSAIMGSNFTKLGPSGVPIYNQDGKFLKDMSSFIPPEDAINTVMFGVASES